MRTLGHERIRTEWAAMIRAYPNHHIATLTYNQPVSSRDLAIRDLKRYVRSLERPAQNGVWYFAGIEGDGVGLLVHLHVILGGTDGLTIRMLRSYWGHGIARIEVFDPDKHGIEYLTKSLDRGGELEFSGHVPRLVRRWRRRVARKAT